MPSSTSIKALSLSAVLLIVLIVALPLITLPSTSVGAPTGKVRVAATVFPLYDFARNVGGDTVDVKLLIPPGQDFHDWEPTPSTMRIITESKVLLYNGMGLDPWVEAAVETAGDSGLIVVRATEGVYAMDDNPHVWLDPANARRQVELIRDALVTADPANRELYEKNAEAYSASLKELDREISTELGKFTRREFIVFHNSFIYFAEKYELEQYTITGGDPEREPTAQDIIQLIQLARTKAVTAIYREPMQDERLVQAVAEHIGGRVLTLNPMDGVTPEDFNQGVGYLSIMRQNVRSLAEGFED
ncbi:MAG: metal ABC transporter substrate-binding protein [Candidatus Bathyarchaeia archaeon]